MQNFLLASQITAIAILIAGVIILGRVMPKIWAESRVKNGLIDLREALLASGGSALILGIVAVILLLTRYIVPADTFRIIGAILLNVFALVYLVFCLAKDRIYNEQFSQRQKELHERIAAIENKEDVRDERREVARVKLNKDRRNDTKRRNKHA